MGPAESRFRAYAAGRITTSLFLDPGMRFSLDEFDNLWISYPDGSSIGQRPDGTVHTSIVASLAERLTG